MRLSSEQTVDDLDQESIVKQGRTKEPILETESWLLEVLLTISNKLRVQAEHGLDLRVTESAGGGRVLVPGGWVDLVVVVGISVLLWDQVVVGAEDWTEDDWQVLVVGDHLVLGDVQTTSLLEEGLVVVSWMTKSQVDSVDVVVSEHQKMEGGETGVLVNTSITSQETASRALLLASRVGDRQQNLIVLARACSQETTSEGTQLLGLLLSVSVDVRKVNESGVLVQLLTGSKLAEWADTRSDEVETGNVVASVELVAWWNQDWVTSSYTWILTAVDEAVVG